MKVFLDTSVYIAEALLGAAAQRPFEGIQFQQMAVIADQIVRATFERRLENGTNSCNASSLL
jgi:hypothetical protein